MGATYSIHDADVEQRVTELFDRFITAHCTMGEGAYVCFALFDVAFLEYCVATGSESVEWVNLHLAHNKHRTLTMAMQHGAQRRGTGQVTILSGITLDSFP